MKKLSHFQISDSSSQFGNSTASSSFQSNQDESLCDSSFPFGNSTASSSFQSNQDESLCKKLDLDTKLNKSHRSWHEEVIPLSNQVIPVSRFGNSTASSSFQSNQDESLCKKLDLDT
ncbi:hypothetical protein Bca4012_102702 [Brassica carinata]